MNLHLLTLNFPQAPCWCVSFGVVTAFSLHFVWGKNCSSKCRKRFLIGENDKRHLKPYIPQGGSRFSEKQLKHQFTGTSTEPEILACEALFWRKLRAKTSSELHGVLFKCTVGVIAVTSPQSKLLFFCPFISTFSTWTAVSEPSHDSYVFLKDLACFQVLHKYQSL